MKIVLYEMEVGAFKIQLWYRKSSVHLRGLFRRGGLFNLAKIMVSTLHKELERNVEKLSVMKLEVMQGRSKNKVNEPYWINHLKCYSRD